jgi:hypothetical protein
LGIFYINETAEERKAHEKQRDQELREIAAETMRIVQNVGKDVFPDFLWEAQINDFEVSDDYRTKACCTNPAVLRAYSIGRKYANYWEYLEALDAYTEYAKYIEAVFGSFEMMQRANRDGYSSVFIPPLPKLTHKKKNKLLIETGFLPSRIDEEFEIDDEVISEQITELPENELSFNPDEELPKDIQRIQERMIGNKAKSDRVAGLFQYNAGRQYQQGMDAIVAFLSSAPNESIRDTKDGTESLAEQIDALHEFEGIPADILTYLLMPQSTIIADGRLQNQRERELSELIGILETNGFNFLETSATKGLKTAAVRALRRKFGEDVDLSKMTKKQRKKYKKKMREYEEDKRKAIAGDRRIQQQLLKNRIHLSRSEGEEFGVDSLNVNFHLSDVLGGFEDE